MYVRVSLELPGLSRERAHEMGAKTTHLTNMRNQVILA